MLEYILLQTILLYVVVLLIDCYHYHGIPGIIVLYILIISGPFLKVPGLGKPRIVFW